MKERKLPTEINRHEIFNDTEEEIIFAYNDEGLFENSNANIEVIFDLYLESKDNRVKTHNNKINENN